MAKININAPTNLSTVKSTYSGGNNLRDYLPGANTVSANEVGMNGFIPGSGTIKLSDFRGATNVNVPATAYAHARNTGYTGAGATEAFTFCCLELSNTGIFLYTTENLAVVDQGQIFAPTAPDNTWCVRTISNSIAQITNNFEFRYVPTSGNASGADWAIDEFVRTQIFLGSTAGEPNTWYTGNVIFSLYALADIPDTTIEKTSNGTITIRRTDTQATVANITVGFLSRAQTITGDPP